MTELLAPGVYTLETSFRARSIQGVGTSTTGFVGLARTGPVGGPPRLVTSFAEFERIFGGLGDVAPESGPQPSSLNYSAYAVRHFFAERGARLYFARAFASVSENDTGHASATLRDVGISQLILASRFPGSASNGTVDVAESVSAATDEAIANAPVGTLSRTQGAGATPAALAATAPPAPLADGDELTVAVSAGAAETLTFNGGKAIVTGQDALTFPINVGPGQTLVITADGLRQVIPLPETIATANALRTAINETLQNANAQMFSNRLRITSDARGTGVTVTVETQALVGVTSDLTRAGTGNVARLDGISVTDLNTALADAAVTDARFVAGLGGELIFETTTTGAAASVSIAGTDPAVQAKLGYSSDSATGADGSDRSYYIRESSVAEGWQRYTLQGGNWTKQGALTDPTSALSDVDHIVRVNLSYVNADGVAVSYDDMSVVAGDPRYFGNKMAPTPSGEVPSISDPLVLTAENINAATIHATLFAGAEANGDDVLTRSFALSNGNDGAMPPLATWEGALERLNTYDDISIVAAPGSSAYPLVDLNMRKALIRHASTSGYRIAVLDPPPGQDLPALRKTRGQVDSNYAALYAPWVKVANPLARPGNDAIPREVFVPPSGHICGIYARNDQLRGVHKTPANEVITTALGFETEYNQAQQGVLNPIGVNCLRTLKGRGNRVYGGRLATSDREVLYVSDRRYLNFIKQSIYESMQWAVFEPNGPVLWSNVRQAVQSFLYNQWFNDALFGATPEQAYFVACDGSTMTQADLDNGRLICEVGLSLLKPAEFVVFRIGQWTADQRA
ncbi:MAG: phage tail sheath subtilisin-like domain-containing protein [Aliishimia sp.]